MTYSHDGFGLGHLRRSVRLAARVVSMREDATVLVATGSWVSHYFRFPSAVDYMKLPSITKLSNDNYVAKNLKLERDEIIRVRGSILKAAVQTYDPDVLLVDRYPLGVQKELLPALTTLESSRSRTRLILGLRDILDDPSSAQDEWKRKDHTGSIARFYDRVLFYGDRDTFDPIAEYELPEAVAKKSMFTGYLAESDCTKPPSRVRKLIGATAGRLAVCALGGGEDAAPIARAFIGAMQTLNDQGWRGILITGPFMPTPELAQLRSQGEGAHVLVRPFVDDLGSYLNAADVVVSMAGYNTMCELLAIPTPCVVVPRTHPRTEQLLRARRFEERGIVRVELPDDLTAGSLADAILERSAIPPETLAARVQQGFAPNGLDRAAEAILELGVKH